LLTWRRDTHNSSEILVGHLVNEVVIATRARRSGRHQSRRQHPRLTAGPDRFAATGDLRSQQLRLASSVPERLRQAFVLIT
jgi:hypothetical protein